MSVLALGFDYWRRLAESWNRFWFEPRGPETLCLMRFLSGTLLFYTHLVWTLQLTQFLGPQAWISNELARRTAQNGYTWSYLWYIDSPALLWLVHALALIVFALYAVGLFTRVVSVLAWLITVAYCHRLQGALFGLDQINSMMVMYLMLAPAGACYSLDRWLQRRRLGREAPPVGLSPSANIATRLLQLHLCVIYLFGGLAKVRGESWWDGSAMWFAVANLEYQSLSLTWLVHYPWILALVAHLTVFWETYYCALVWPRLTRPWTLGVAVLVHGGIALCLGMITFGMGMIFANMSFVEPATTRRWLRRFERD